jgi:hypothetical protein
VSGWMSINLYGKYLWLFVCCLSPATKWRKRCSLEKSMMTITRDFMKQNRFCQQNMSRLLQQLQASFPTGPNDESYENHFSRLTLQGLEEAIKTPPGDPIQTCIAGYIAEWAKQG